MIHHLGVFASDFAASRAFFSAALRPWRSSPGTRRKAFAVLALQERHAIPVPPSRRRRSPAGSTWRSKPRVARRWTRSSRPPSPRAVRSCMRLGIGPEYRAYCAFVSDPDGNNIEAGLVEAESAAQEPSGSHRGSDVRPHQRGVRSRQDHRRAGAPTAARIRRPSTPSGWG